MDINAKKSFIASNQCPQPQTIGKVPSRRRVSRIRQVSFGCLALLGGIGSAHAALSSLVVVPAQLSGESHLARVSYHKGHSGRDYALSHKHIVPITLPDGLVLNLPQRMIYLFHGGHLSAAYPIAVGMADWRTPMGNFKITNLQRNKTWHVPKSIQEEMRNEGQVVKTSVPPGPKNPLGKYWIGVSLPGIGIHGTIAPSSIYRFASHGCVRLNPHDIEALYSQVHVGEHGKVVYQPVLLARTADGHIFAEANPDPYHKGPANPMQYLEAEAAANHLTDAVDWGAVQKVLAHHDGIAHEVGKGATGTVYAYEGHHAAGVKVHHQEAPSPATVIREPEVVEVPGPEAGPPPYPVIYGPVMVGPEMPPGPPPMPVIIWPHP